MGIRRPVLISVLVAIAGGACWIWSLDSGPSYRGKSIEHYVRQLSGPSDGTLSRQDFAASRDEAQAALHEMGPDAVRWCVSRIEWKETRLQSLYRKSWGVLPVGIRNFLPDPKQPPTSADSILEPSVVRALCQLGEPAVGILTNYLDSARYGQTTRHDAYMALSTAPMAASAESALPMLENNMRHTNAFDRVYSASAISRIDSLRNDEVVDVLLESLQTNRRVIAVDFLGGMREDASNSIPALETALLDPDPTYRERVRVALQKISGRAYPKKLKAQDR